MGMAPGRSENCIVCCERKRYGASIQLLSPLAVCGCIVRRREALSRPSPDWWAICSLEGEGVGDSGGLRVGGECDALEGSRSIGSGESGPADPWFEVTGV